MDTVAAMPAETPEHIARLFQVSSGLVLSGQFDVARYPHQNLVVVCTRGFWYARLAEVLAAAQMLEPAGFVLLHTMQIPEGNAFCAVLQRR